MGLKISDQDKELGKRENVEQEILLFYKKARSKKEISNHIGYKNLTYLTRKVLKPMIQSEKLLYTIPEKLLSRTPLTCNKIT